MIHFLVPPANSGGVYDFSCKLRDAVGPQAVRLVHLSKATVSEWLVEPDDVVVLQLSSYGFARRGVPLWLLREIENRRERIKTLGVFFHELYAFGPPWSSAFWLSPLQRHIAHRLAELSDFWMTNREGSAQWLRKFAGEKPHAALPVFSNVGETPRPSSSRAARIVVFGSPGVRQKTYQAAGDGLFAWAKVAGLQVHDIGSRIGDAQTANRLAVNGVIQHGRMEERDISQLLHDALFGLLAYPVEFVAKSGIFAAYAAHGVCPILVSNSHDETDGLKAGTHYLPGVACTKVPESAGSIGRAAWEWYQRHNVSSHADALKKLAGGFRGC